MVKINDFRAQQYPEVEGLRCVTVWIPDDDAFMPLLGGLLYLPTRVFNYVGGTPEHRAELARMWIDAYGQNDWEGCMDCETVANCIETDTDTQDAIADAIRNNTNIKNAINETYDPLQPGGNPPESVSGAPLNAPNEGCDPDIVWGQVDSLIESMNTNNIDSQELIEVFTNVAERLTQVLAAIPGLGILPFDEIVDYVQNIWTDDLFENYIATDTTEYRDQLKCDLFCLARANDCNLSLDMVYEYFLTRLSASPEDTLSDIIVYLAAGTWSGTEVNDLFYAAQALFLKYGNKYFAMVGLKPFNIYMALGEPSDDWLLICEECVFEWDFVIDFETGENVDFCNITWGDYEVGVGVHQEYDPSGSGYLVTNILWTTTAGMVLDHAEVEADYVAGTLGATGDASWYFRWGTGAPLVSVIVPSEPVFPEVWDGSAIGGLTDELGLQIICDTDADAHPTGTSLLKRIVLHGTGTPPAG